MIKSLWKRKLFRITSSVGLPKPAKLLSLSWHFEKTIISTFATFFTFKSRNDWSHVVVIQTDVILSPSNQVLLTTSSSLLKPKVSIFCQTLRFAYSSRSINYALVGMLASHAIGINQAYFFCTHEKLTTTVREVVPVQRIRRGHFPFRSCRFDRT